MNISKDLTKMLKPVGKLLKNKSVRIPLIVLLVVYISSAIPQLTRQVNTFMNNLIIRLLVLAGVIYLVQKDLLLALLLLTLYIMTSNKVSEYMTDMKKEGEDKKEHDEKKKHDDSKKEEDKESEHDKKMKKENMAPMATDRMDSLGDDDEEAFTLFEGMAHSDEEEETEDFTSGCVPKASNSPIKCFSNEKNVSPCSPCGEVGAFDKEMSTQGLSGVMGYPGSELSSF